MKYFAYDLTITTLTQIHSPASNMYYFQIGGCLFHFYRALDTNIISKHLASLRNKNQRFNFALKLLKVQSVPTSVMVPHLSGHWIRICMDLHSFSLLDPDLHSICGSASRRINFPIQTTPNARQWLITASFVPISVLKVNFTTFLFLIFQQSFMFFATKHISLLIFPLKFGKLDLALAWIRNLIRIQNMY